MTRIPDLRRHWMHFAISASAMFILAVFTVWRAAVTAWRAVPDRFYFFTDGGWLSRIDHGWFNDFLLGPGTVACFFVAFTVLYAVDSLFHIQTAGTYSSWADHKRLMKIILYGLLVRALIGGWGEEVGVFASTLVFDPWDLTVELGGIVLGAWMVDMLYHLGPSDNSRPASSSSNAIRTASRVDSSH